MRKKVTVVGAGNVGATAAQLIFNRGYADVVLVDIVEGLPQGKALDILQSGPVIGSDARIVGTNSYEETAGSDVVVITSGIARKPGMSRDDLLFTNMDIVGGVTRQAVARSPNAIVIVVTNPLDAMTHHAHEVAGLPRERIIGMAGVLDSARFRTFLAQELQVSVQVVHAYVLGGHGDTMVPLIGYTNVGGVPVTELLPRDRLEAIVKRTREGGAEIVSLLKAGSAYYAPGASVAQMVEAALLDRHQIFLCCVHLEGEYGIRDLCVGVPAKLGDQGVEEILELKLSPEEEAQFKRSTESVRELVDKMHARSAR